MEERVCRSNDLHLGEMRRTDELGPSSFRSQATKTRSATHLDRHVDVLGFYTEPFNGAVRYFDPCPDTSA